jgi:hypothetical protein
MLDCKIRHTRRTLAGSSPFDAAQTGGTDPGPWRDEFESLHPRIADESDANLPGRGVVNCQVVADEE